MLDEKDLLQDDDLNPEDIQESLDNPALLEKDVPVIELLEEEVALETLVEADDYSGPHDEFDWSVTNKNAVNYSPEVEQKYLADYDATFSTIQDGQVLQGVVASVTGNDVIFDIRFKSDGLIPLSEFRELDLKPGDKVEIYVERTEDEHGHLVLSRKKAKLLRAWEGLVDSYKNGTIIKGSVISKTKGGLIVDCNGLETFLPGSQIDIKPIVDYDAYVGKTMEFKVVKINETIKNAVVSHKALIEGDLQEQREQIISGLEKGQVLEGTVKNITDFGAFLDLGGVDGLLYITDISWGRINHPSEVLEKNQKINVVVLDFDENKKRISLGLKQLQPHPWDVLPADVVEGSVVKGKIVNIEDYGAFLEIYPGVEGLIHVSEVNWNSQPVHAKDFFFQGQEFEAKVVTIDREERKMSLSLKQLTEDPWTHVQQNFSVGTRHTGVVKNLTPYGVFVEMGEGIGGMVHISDLSWTKRFNHPSEFTKVGNKLDVQVLDIDMENRKLSLGHKQLEENPWDTFENVFPEGSYHEATVLRKDDRGYTVQLPYGLEAYAPIKFMKKENGQNANVEEILTVKVIEFNRDEKKIIVSHSRYLEDIRREADDNVRKEKDQERQVTKKAVEKQQSKVEMTTLGEIEGFSALKEQLQESAKAKLEAQTKVEVKEEAKVEAPATNLFNEPVQAEEKPKAKAAKAAKGDDLKIIEGIGPKIAELLHAEGVVTFKDLAVTPLEKLKEVLEAAGSRYRMHDPTTWPEQANLAAEGRMDELKTLQDSLKGGKVE
ncbi:MAG: 30S ribosomal protein S1 [Saprospiraceae bacterium]|nr:30S ribosomal protein S1 [Candidatus Vicinibacter affinis]HQX44079.1 30S ribosomal protein S1 [Saprospiraceae bacterium]MBK7302179.1 30S ribosomal protein S1 [Candidatus Vicinibacter affinis]MBK7693321.1 30S ribosomal protein S1 [Candidatus Vicinibacter affinis]MBK8403061.1 30S ribosomal protein S1 [Candidatus Vicinibacter affinis]